MATMQTLLDDLNDRLNDVNNAAGAGEANKMRYINHGIRAMYPKVYRTVVDSSLVVAADTFEYELPATFDHAKIVRVEIEVDQDNGRFAHLDNFEIVPTLPDKKLRIDSVELPVETGALIRVVGVRPMTELTTVGSTYDGPPGTEEIPVWYALGLVLSRRIEDRTVHTRYATAHARNGVGIDEMWSSAQFAFGQFELLLDRYEMPLPAQAG